MTTSGIGPTSYDATEKDLWELRVALEDLLKRVGTPA